MARGHRSLLTILFWGTLLLSTKAQDASDETCSAEGGCSSEEEKEAASEGKESIEDIRRANARDEAVNDEMRANLVRRDATASLKTAHLMKTNAADYVRSMLPRPGAVEDAEAKEIWEANRKGLVDIDILQNKLARTSTEHAMELAGFVDRVTDVQKMINRSNCLNNKTMKCDMSAYKIQIGRLRSKLEEIGKVQKAFELHKQEHNAAEDGLVERMNKAMDLLPNTIDVDKDLLNKTAEIIKNHAISGEYIGGLNKKEQLLVLAQKIREVAIEKEEDDIDILKDTEKLLKERTKELDLGMHELSADIQRVDSDVTKYAEKVKAESQGELEKITVHAKNTKNQLDKKMSEAELKLQEKQTETELEFASLETKESPNHFIFVLDKSGSMGGVRWDALVKAYERFILTRQQRSMDDAVSLITFNHDAHIDFTKQPINGQAAQKIKASPGGGTAFAPAWKAALQVARESGMRTVIIFMTDGEAGDVGQAAEMAEKIYRAREKAGILSFVVAMELNHYGNALEPIVRNGNGGKNTYDAHGATHKLLMEVSASELSQAFATIASTADPREQMMKDKIEREGQMFTKQGERRKQTRELINEIQADAEALMNKQSAMAQRLSSAKELDGKDVKRLMQKQIEYKQEAISKMETKLEETKTLALAKKQRVEELQSNITLAKKQLDDIKENNAKLIEQAKKTMELSVNELKLLNDEKESWQKKTALGDAKDVKTLVFGLTYQKEAFVEEGKAIAAAAKSLQSLHDYGSDLVSHLEEQPSNSLPAAQMFHYIAQHYRDIVGVEELADLGLAAPKVLRAILKQLANDLQMEDADKIVAAIVKTVGYEDIAQINLEELNKKLEGEWKGKLLDSKEFGNKEVNEKRKHIDRLKKNVEKAKKEISDFKIKIGDADEQGKEDKVEYWTEKKKASEAKLEEAENDLAEFDAELKDLLKDSLSPAVTLLRHFVSEWDKVYSMSVSEQEKKRLTEQMTSFNDRVAPTVRNMITKLEEAPRKATLPNLEAPGNRAAITR